MCVRGPMHKCPLEGHDRIYKHHSTLCKLTFVEKNTSSAIFYGGGRLVGQKTFSPTLQSLPQQALRLTLKVTLHLKTGQKYGYALIKKAGFKIRANGFFDFSCISW